MGPKPVAGEDQTGFSLDDWNTSELNLFLIFALHNGNSLYMIIIIIVMKLLWLTILLCRA